MRGLLLVTLLLFGLFQPQISSAQVAWTGTAPVDPQKFDPNVVGAGGEYTQSVAIDMPEFRDLPLPISLGYNSSDISRVGVSRTVAFGWTLRGLSMIERKSLGGGAPIYDDGQDLYVLDGQELMACSGSGATNPWALKYPLRFITDKPSASCLSGGNLVSRVDDQRRIVFDAASNTGFVAQFF